MMLINRIFLLAALVCLASACTPKVYVIDRQTVLESESTGEFPDLEKSLDKKAMNYGPKMLDRSKLTEKEVPERAYNILNGELSGENAKK